MTISLAPKISASSFFIPTILETGKLTEGYFVGSLEERLCIATGSRYAIATSSGSSADLVCMLAMKHLYPEKTEVIVPALTFIAQVNAIYMAGLKPVFVDCYPETMQMRMDSLPNLVSEKTLCIFGVHLLGKFSPVFDFNFNVPMIEDACEGFGGSHDNKMFGSFGRAGTFSFYPSHTVSCGEGGAIVTDSEEFSTLCRQIKNHGRSSDSPLDKFRFSIQGTNAKMPEVSASIACETMGRFEDAVSNRVLNCISLSSEFNSDWIAESPHAYPVYCESKEQRDSAVEYLTNKKIECRCMFECIPTDSWCKSLPRGSFPHSENISDTVFYLPVHQDLTTDDLDSMINATKEALNR